MGLPGQPPLPIWQYVILRKCKQMCVNDTKRLGLGCLVC